jgi:hypothetical protein
VTPKWLGSTNWNYCEGWMNCLSEFKVPFRAFHCGDDPDEIKQLFKYIGKNVPELIILSCVDHHAYYLHDTNEKRAFWQSLKSRKVCFNQERIVNSPFPLSKEKTMSAIQAFDGFIYSDEFAKPLFEASGKPSLWSVQFSDEKMFCPRFPFEDRSEKVYFRATLTNLGIEGVYSERRALIESVRNDDVFAIYSDLLPSVKFAKELSQQRFVLRAASNCPGYVESFWNTIASECVVFHQKLPADEVHSIGLLKDGRDIIEYDPQKPEILIKMARDATKNWRDYRKIAEAGRKTFLENFTLRIFMKKLLDFADTKVIAR